MAYITSWYWNKGDFRKVNEDSFTLQRVRARKKELIFAAVCDGIGGEALGDVAAMTALDALHQTLSSPCLLYTSDAADE